MSVCECVLATDVMYETYVSRWCEGHLWAEGVPSVKVPYFVRLDGVQSKAYVSEEPYPGTELHYGTNKHTDLPVVLHWDGVYWTEVTG